MKKAMEILLNRVFKNDLEVLYGEGSYVIIKRIYFSEYHKLYIIDCVLMLSDDCPTDELHETSIHNAHAYLHASFDRTSLGQSSSALFCHTPLAPALAVPRLL